MLVPASVLHQRAYQNKQEINMSKNHIAPSSKSTTSIIEFRRVATPWVTFVAEKPNDIAGQNADPEGTMEDSVDISDPSYNEKKTRTIEVEYAESDHIEPPIHINTLDCSNQKSNQSSEQECEQNSGQPPEQPPAQNSTQSEEEAKDYV